MDRAVRSRPAAVETHARAGAARFELTMALLRALAAVATCVILVARPDGAVRDLPWMVGLHLAVAGWSGLVAVVASRFPSRVTMDRLGLVAMSFDLAFWVLYVAAFHDRQGGGSLFGLFVLVEAAVRYGVVPTAAVAAVVDVSVIVWPTTDATGQTNTAPTVLVLTLVVAGGAHVAARLVRRQATQERDSVRQLSDAFAYASIGLAVVDGTRGVVEAANPALAALLGDDRESLTGVPFVDLVEPSARAELERIAGEVRAGHSAGARFEARVRQAEGRGRWALIALSLAAAEDGDRLVVQVEDIHERKVVEAKLAHQASHDMLTGLPNRAELVELMGAAFDAQEPLALLFIDLDRFKWVNDSLGHEAGDILLVEVADRLRRVLRPGDVVARLGGDEFVVLAHGVREVSTAVALADRVMEAVRRPVSLPGGRESYASASIGIAIAGPEDGPETLLRDADTAMYQAKAAGGAAYALFTPSMRAAAVRHHEVEGALRRAVRAEELTVWYQPEIRLIDGSVRGFEALVRWTDPVWGPVPPSEFVPIAEESDLILELGALVLRQALAQAASWPALPDGTRPVLAVNVSRRQLAQPGFPALVAKSLAASGVPAASVCLEVTETALTQNVESVVTALHELRHLGVQIAIDDFGTGHASLTYLTRLPVDVLKVDRTFVTGLGRDERSAAIVGAVTAMGRAFGLTVVAEGVETDEHMNALRALDVDLAQGFLFSRPVPADHVAGLLSSDPVPAVPEQRGGSVSRLPVPRRPLVSSGDDVRYRLLLDLARDITGRLDLATVLDRTFAALRQLIDFTGGSVQLIDETSHLRLAATDPPATAEALRMRVPLGHGVGGSIALTGEPRYLPDITADADVTDERRKRSTSHGVRSYFGVPLITGGRVIGLLQVDSVEADAWTEGDRLVVLAFTPIVAAAVQNARLLERDLVRREA
ncbi:MAG TPA: EAL domain-containing protein [Frankiaceae bacterium]|nr:EAL domain-containing protein [Frankiaceae bacterium]